MTPDPRKKSNSICFHNHTYYSGGRFGIAEMVRRCVAKGLRTVAITDHADASDIDQVLIRTMKARELSDYWDVNVLAGCEITHAPVKTIGHLIEKAKNLGADLVIVHGETPTEPVEAGTNLAAIHGHADILAHPGYISLAELRLAAEVGVAIELSLRSKQFDGNRHIISVLKEHDLINDVPLVINADAHDDVQIKCDALVEVFEKQCCCPILSHFELPSLYEQVAQTMERLSARRH
jgi:histidinol phosphatase-like PHP family hydrolase